MIEYSPYSPDLAMFDFWLFFSLKKLRGHRFTYDHKYFNSLLENQMVRDVSFIANSFTKVKYKI